MHAEAIYKGATRPAMKLGIPLVPLVALLGGAMLAVMWLGALVTWWAGPVVLCAVAPVLAWMRYVTQRDDQRFRQIFIAARLLIGSGNRGFWHARSYAPYLYRGTSDVCRR